MRYVIVFFLGLLVGAVGLYFWKASPLLPAVPASGAGPGPGPGWLIVPGHDSQGDSAWKLNMRTGELRYCLAGAAPAKPGCEAVSDLNAPQEPPARATAPTQ